MNPRLIGVLLRKEIRFETRNVIIIFATVVPVAVSLMVSLLFGKLFAGTPRLGIMDQGSSQLPVLFQSKPYLDTRIYDSEEALKKDVTSGIVEVGIVIPSGFDQALKTSDQTDVTVYEWGEGSVTDRATLLTTLAKNIVELTGRETPVTVEGVTLGSGDAAPLADRLLPLLVLVTIILGGSMIPAVSVIDEKQRRTLQALTITPASLGDVLISKALLGMGISMMMGILILILNRAFGSQPTLLVLSLALGSVAAAEFGILLGVLSKDITTLFTIFKAMGLLLYAPAIVTLVPQIPQWIAQFFPTYYMMAPVQNIALNGAGFNEVAGQLLALVGLIALLFVALIFIVRRRMERDVIAA